MGYNIIKEFGKYLSIISIGALSTVCCKKHFDGTNYKPEDLKEKRIRNIQNKN